MMNISTHMMAMIMLMITTTMMKITIYDNEEIGNDKEEKVRWEGKGRNSELVVLAKWVSTSPRLYSPQTFNPNTKK